MFDLSEQIKAATKDSHVRAENTKLMLSYQRGQITLPQYKLLLFSLYEIYKALEEALDGNAAHPAVAPVYFPLELARLEHLEKDLEHFYGEHWRDRVIVPAATHRYTQRLRQVLGRITQKSLGLENGKGLSFFSFPAVSSPNRFKQLYRSRMNSIELTKEEKQGVLEEAVRAFELNIEVREGAGGDAAVENFGKHMVFDDLLKMLTLAETETETGVRQRQKAQSHNRAAGEASNGIAEKVENSGSDLSELIKTATKDSHVRAENTQLMLSYQRGEITLPQYK
ncbi:Heme oxygenase-like, partial [Scleropages formosus]